VVCADPVQQAVFQATRAGFRAAAVAGRTFQAGQRLARPARLPAGPERDLLDITPTDDHRMIVETVREFAAEQLRHAPPTPTMPAHPPELRTKAAELGITLLGVPEELGGVGTERATTTNVLVAEALAHGDLGLAVAASRRPPSATRSCCGRRRPAGHLPAAFVGDDVPAAAIAVLEPHPLFDPFVLRTKAVARPPVSCWMA